MKTTTELEDEVADLRVVARLAAEVVRVVRAGRYPWAAAQALGGALELLADRDKRYGRLPTIREERTLRPRAEAAS